MTMRVIAGRLKGRSFDTPEGKGTRPALTRLRRALFDTLWPRLEGALFLDLYGGSGAFAFEALSRGAKRAVIVEADSKAVKVLRANIEKLAVSGDAELVAGDVLATIPRLRSRGLACDLIGVAPPYFKSLQALTIQCLLEHPVFAPRCLVFVQHHPSETIEHEHRGLRFKESRRYGETVFTFFEAE